MAALCFGLFFFNDTATAEGYTPPLPGAGPMSETESPQIDCKKLPGCDGVIVCPLCARSVPRLCPDYAFSLLALCPPYARSLPWIAFVPQQRFRLGVLISLHPEGGEVRDRIPTN